MPDEKLESEDESEGGEEAEELEVVGEKQKSKGKAKAVPKKARKEHNEWDGSSDGVYEMLWISSFY
jgi:hypothetical protein